MAVAVDASGQVLVLDAKAGTNSTGAVFRIDPPTGRRLLIHDFGNPNLAAPGTPVPVNLVKPAIERSGHILALAGSLFPAIRNL